MYDQVQVAYQKQRERTRKLRQERDELRAALEQLEQEPVACFIGIKGSAFDLPTTKRAYTYEEQPGNVVAWKLGQSLETAKRFPPGGDSIDDGLALLKTLQAEGFGVFQLGAEYTALRDALEEPEQPEQEPATNADDWLRSRYGSVRGHAEWRELIEAFNAGRASVHMHEQEPVALCDPAEYDDFQGAVSRNCASANSPNRHAPVTMETVYETIIHWDEGGGKRSRRELARRIVDLYTTPPRREWQSLTDQEITDIFEAQPRYHYPPICATDRWFARDIEAALKERNT
jgi:hypothetical protein